MSTFASFSASDACSIHKDSDGASTNTLLTFGDVPDCAILERDYNARIVVEPQRPTSEIRRLQVHSEIIHRLDQFILKNQIPHMIFHGPPGAGKLTLVRDFILRIYEGDVLKTKTHVMTVNCSHGKGIQFIREELKFFAKANAQTKSSGDFKIILLLNAHHLTVDAQSALRRCIELFSYNTRFFIVVENKNKLLNPILSRFCDVFVPEPYHPDTGEPINLHQYVLSQQFAKNSGEDGPPNVNAFTVGDDYALIKFALLDSAFSEYSVKTNPAFSEYSVKTKPAFSEYSVKTKPAFSEYSVKTKPAFSEYSVKTKPAFSAERMMSLVNSLYESGISCVDFMDWVGNRRDKWSELDHSRVVMHFYQIKPQFRCEKLLMLFMVNFLYGKGCNKGSA
jgi:hypothetical protein